MNRLIARVAITIAALLLAAIIALAGISFLCLAIYFALLQYLLPPMAALATAGVMFVLAALIFLAGRATSAMMRSRRRSREEPLSTAALGELFGHEFSTRAAAHPHATLFASLLAGFAVGASADLRHFLRDLLFKR
jgi:hypothetical protein